MKRHLNRTDTWSLTTTLLVNALFLLLASCTAIRSASYPPNFVYLDEKQVRSTMHKLAISIGKLDTLLQQPDTLAISRKDDVLTELDTIIVATDGMAADASISSHRLITDNMGRFRHSVWQARAAVEQDVPDYAPTSQLVTQCLDCHLRNISEPDRY